MPGCTVTLLVRWAELAYAALSHFVHTPNPPPPTTLLTTTISKHSSGTLPDIAVCLCTAPLRSAQGSCHTADLGEASTSFPLSFTQFLHDTNSTHSKHTPHNTSLVLNKHTVSGIVIFAIRGGIAKCTSPLPRCRYSGPNQLILFSLSHIHTSSLTPSRPQPTSSTQPTASTSN